MRTLKRALLIFLSCILSAVLIPGSGQAADFRLTGSKFATDDWGHPVFEKLSNERPCAVELKGPIEPGDLEKYKAAMEQVRHERQLDIRAFGMCLDSPGGSFQEAIKIARYMLGKDQKHNKWLARYNAWTVVADGAECLSACAIIFMAGNYYEGANGFGAVVERYLHPGGRLGFHSPYIQLADIEGGYSKETVENTFAAAVQAVRDIVALPDGVNGGGSKETSRFMPPHLIIQMLARGPGELYEIDSVQRASRLDIAVYGIRVPKKPNNLQYCNVCTNKFYVDWAEDRDEFLCTSEFERRRKGQLRRSGNATRLWFHEYGGDNAFSCIFELPKGSEPLKIHNKLVEEKNKKLEWYDFDKIPMQYYYSPKAKLRALARQR